MAVPVATAIRRSQSEGVPSVTWAVEQRCRAVIDDERLVDGRVEFPRDEWKRRRWSPATWRAQLAWYGRLRKAGYDYGIDLQGHSKTALCLRIAKPRHRLAARATDGFAARLNPIAAGNEADQHVVERNLEVLRQLSGIEAEPAFIMPAYRDLRARFRGAVPLATINVAAGAPDKCYPLERWVAVAAALRSLGYRTAFVGGPGDPVPDDPDSEILVGKLKLEETIAAVAESSIHLAGDTGTGHIAAAYGVPVVSVFGPTDPARYRPYATAGRGIVLRSGRSTEEVPSEQVIEAAARLQETLRA